MLSTTFVECQYIYPPPPASFLSNTGSAFGMLGEGVFLFRERLSVCLLDFIFFPLRYTFRSATMLPSLKIMKSTANQTACWYSFAPSHNARLRSLLLPLESQVGRFPDSENSIQIFLHEKIL